MKKEPKDAVILIPSLNPDEKMIKLVKELKEAGFKNIVCVDDGSDEQHRAFFDRAKEEYGCDVLRHCINMGKGRAIKTGLNHIKNTYADVPGVITVDGDGQHSVLDTTNCAKALTEHEDSVIFGCRRFKDAGVPFRSYFGNTLTRWVMKLLCGISLSDTQTGLRGIPWELIPVFVNAPGERYEYEMQQILICKEKGIPLVEVPIQTIYIEENKSSHFNPLKDSVRIYAQFGKFIFSSLSSSVIDIVLFSLFVKLLSGSFGGSDIYITAATVTARIISAVWNFTMNKRVVFRSDAKIKNSALKYMILAVCQMAMSALLVTLFFRLTGKNETIIKIIVDTALFFISFQIQRELVFKER